MTPQEIISEIRKLPAGDWEAIKESVDSLTSDLGNSPITEGELNRILLAKGVIANIPDLSQWTEEDENWEPIEIKGKPTSEIIIEDRR